uniref:Uncharacterized protein n=1 Tax=Ditylenchus dipsaci TaxID=166011 RepID=A0A915DMM4_9BILA
MMDYSSTDEATTSEDDENSVERQQNLVARSCNFQEEEPRKESRVKQLVIHQGDFFSFASKKLKKLGLACLM